MNKADKKMFELMEIAIQIVMIEDRELLEELAKL